MNEIFGVEPKTRFGEKLKKGLELFASGCLAVPVLALLITLGILDDQFAGRDAEISQSPKRNLDV